MYIYIYIYTIKYNKITKKQYLAFSGDVNF